MKKIIFKIVDIDFPVVKATEEKYILLSLFVGDHRFISDIQDMIDMLEKVQRGENTWAELVQPYGNIDDLPFAYGSGFLECTPETALFMSYDNTYKTIEMPLQELIDLMKEWLEFMGGKAV